MPIIEIDSTNAIPEIKKAPKGMLTVEKKDGVTHVRINSSSLSIIQQCPRKAYYSLYRGLASKVESPATLFGSAIHSAMEVFYSAPKEERILPINMKKNLELMSYGTRLEDENSYMVYRATRAFIDRAEPLSKLSPEDKRSIQNGVWMLTHYYETYIDDPYTVYVDKKGPFVERTLEVELHKSPHLVITLFGTIDVILQNMANGQILVTDHKTTSMMGKDFYNRLRPNHQYSGYLYLVQKSLGIQLDKFLVNGIEVKAKPKTARGSKPNFARQTTSRSPEDMEEFEHTVHYFVEQYLHWMWTTRWPLGTVDACANWGGCQYLEVCSSPSSIRENIINANYIGATQ